MSEATQGNTGGGYLTPLRSPEQEQFLASEITARQYLAHAWNVAETSVAKDQRFATAERRRLEKHSLIIRRLVRVTFVAIAPLAYVTVGVVLLSTRMSTQIGVLSITTGAAMGSAAAIIVRALARSNRDRDGTPL